MKIFGGICYIHPGSSGLLFEYNCGKIFLSGEIMESKIVRLKNDIEFFYKQNKNTPRAALCMNFALNDYDSAPGVYALMARLLFQGTKTRSAEQIAEEFDSCGIDFVVEMKMDYLRFRFMSLNEDFEHAVELVTDLVKNSTFDEFEKEKAKLQGELIAELDSPRQKVMDGFTRNIFEGHSYGTSSTTILENLQNITKNQVIEAYQNLYANAKKVITFVGDIEAGKVEKILNENFGDIPAGAETAFKNVPKSIETNKEIFLAKPDANQAHIIKGWRTETFDSNDYPALILLNIILGASGLSSRLFLELRDKKGLAYVVRSSYESFLLCGAFSIYIATEPKNIEVSLKGFDEELEKIKTIEVSEEELENAKTNLLGKLAFSFETNSQQACSHAQYGILGLGFDFYEKTKERIKHVTSEQIKNCALKYFNDKSVLVILKP